MLWIKVATAAVGASLAFAARGAACPATECNYQDPQYQANLKKWSACVDDYSNQYMQTIDLLTVVYPKFGIAYRAMLDEEKSAARADGTTDQAVVEEAQRRFDDRILRTAEPEALKTYNRLRLQMQQHPIEVQCGPAPDPPRRQLR